MQLTGSQWMAALPEDTPERRRLKQIFQGLCTSCHVPQFVLLNRFDEAGWRAIITAMETFGSTGSWSKTPNPIVQYHKEELAAYLAEMRGPGPSPMKVQVPARPKGDAARVVITEYDIPPAETPGRLVPHDGSDWSEGSPAAYLAKGLHDVVPDLDGNAWINDSITNKHRTYAKVDAKTGKVTNFTVPGREYVRGSHSMAVGPDGIIWMDLYPASTGPADEGEQGVSGNASLARHDPRTDKVELFDAPKGMTAVHDFVAVDGKNKVWVVTRNGALRFDPETRQFTHDFKSPTLGFYDVAGDVDGNGWWAIIRHDRLGFGDVTTGKVTEITLQPRKEADFATPQDREFYQKVGKGASTFGNNIGVPWAQAPRRLGADPDRPVLWVANWFGQNIAEVNTRTHKVTYHRSPIANSSPYDTDVDVDGIVYVSLRNAEAVGKFNPQTKQWTVYPLPTQGAEARHISVDRLRGDVWLPYWRTSKVARLQFRTEQEIRAALAR
jgi:streptogramin lyase